MRSGLSRKYPSSWSQLFRRDADAAAARSEGTHAKYHYLICGVQGDFTRSLVNDPPTHVWTRQLKVRTRAVLFGLTSLTFLCAQFAGVSHTSTLYKRGIRVCTGTGLGAALSTCLQVRALPLSRENVGVSNELYAPLQ